MTTLKKMPRWEEWERNCVKRAFEEKIQNKVIAAALGRTPNSISKEIKNLGLRSPSSQRGRVKGSYSSFAMKEGGKKAFQRMKEIVESFAPVNIFQCKELSSKDSFWVAANPISKCRHTQKKKVSGYQSLPVKGESSTKNLRLLGAVVEQDALYVSSEYIEEWASSKGFYELRRPFQEKGVTYWKEGEYYSKAQILMHINEQRLRKKLRPIVLDEEER